MLSFPTFPIADIQFSTLSFPTLCSIMSKTGMSEMEMSEMITNPYKLQYNKYPNQKNVYIFETMQINKLTTFNKHCNDNSTIVIQFIL